MLLGELGTSKEAALLRVVAGICVGGGGGRQMRVGGERGPAATGADMRSGEQSINVPQSVLFLLTFL